MTTLFSTPSNLAQTQELKENITSLLSIAASALTRVRSVKPVSKHISVGIVPVNRLSTSSKDTVNKQDDCQNKIEAKSYFKYSPKPMNYLHSFERRPISDGILPVKLFSPIFKASKNIVSGTDLITCKLSRLQPTKIC